MKFFRLCILAGGIFGFNFLLTTFVKAQGQLNRIPEDSPFTYLVDTGKTSANPLGPEDFAAQTGWQVLPEDQLQHQFTGDAVILNDKLAVVIRRQAAGAEVYAKADQSWKPRAGLAVQSADSTSADRLTAIKIIENNPGAAVLRLDYATEKNNKITVAYRLTTGQVYLEVQPGAGMGKLFTRIDSGYLIVPDFFGDDMVWCAEFFAGEKIGLPAENYFLHLLADRAGLVMAVWEADGIEAAGVFDRQNGKNIIIGSEIGCVLDQRIWLAFIEGKDLWHEEKISSLKQEHFKLKWELPFAAKWRADFVGGGNFSRSVLFSGADEEELAGAAGIGGGCCELAGNQVNINLGKLSGQDTKSYSTVIVYPLDRSRATPLTVFCPIDIMRNTLGVGPCQYILEKENLGTELHPTPDQVTGWVEKQFQKKKEKALADEINLRFEQMLDHIDRARTRIGEYRDFAGQVRRLAEPLAGDPNIADAIKALRETAKHIEKNVAAMADDAQNPQAARQLVDKITALIEKEDNVLPDCQAWGSKLRAIGAAQDRAISQCRMAVRWLRVQGKMVGAKYPGLAETAGKIQKLAQEMMTQK